MKDTINKRLKSLDTSNIINLKKIIYEPRQYEVLGDHKREGVFKQSDNVRKSDQIGNMIHRHSLFVTTRLKMGKKKKKKELIDENCKELDHGKKQNKRKGPGWSLSNDSPKTLVIKRSPFTKRFVIKTRDQLDTNTADKEDLTLFLENPYKSLDDKSQLHTTFLLIHRIYKCLTCGGYLTDKLHLPIDIW
jgi:hypothetical protein